MRRSLNTVWEIQYRASNDPVVRNAIILSLVKATKILRRIQRVANVKWHICLEAVMSVSLSSNSKVNTMENILNLLKSYF